MTSPYIPGSWRARFRWPARIAYLLVLLLATLTPFDADPSRAHVAERIARALHPQIAGSDVVDAARNIVLFAGWGVIWALTAAGSARRTVVHATVMGAGISAVIESAQLFSSNRNSSFLDVSTNTAGALGGALVLLVLIALAREHREGRSPIGLPALAFAGSYIAAVWLEAVIPLFRHDSVPGASGWPATRFAASLAAFQWSSVLSVDLRDALLFFPAGALAVAALAEHGWTLRGALRRTAAGAVVFAFTAELLHGCLGEPILVGAVMVHSAAMVAGAGMAAYLLPRTNRLEYPSRGMARAVTVVYAVILAAWILRPFVLDLSASAVQAKLARPWYVPLAASTWQLNFFSVADVCVPFFLFLPLGALLSAWPCRRTGILSGPVPAVLLAIAFEAMQLIIHERLPDITDVLVEASGAIIGYAIIRRAGYPVHGETFPRRPA